jgi:uncharacterized protein YecE (DUF72 family)
MTHFIGTAGWSIPKESAAHFQAEGTHLERYARTFNAVEINSSFYRPHRDDTWRKWAASTPDRFRFSVKIPKTITHAPSLRCAGDFDVFLSSVRHLGGKLGPLLVQFPPGRSFTPREAAEFFDGVRARFDGDVVCEPRHLSWFTPEGNELLKSRRIARVAADPSICAEASQPGGWPELRYYRLHGSPKVYYSAYAPPFLRTLRADLDASEAPAWVVFDNTALGAATLNALELAAIHAQPQA